ncbi:MAG: NAD+ synthase [Gemmatimonadota bacterium]
MSRLRLALAQMNPTVGDLDGNTASIIHYLEEARAAGADLAAFPELAVCGYPPEDLLLKPAFIAANRAAVARIAPHTRGLTAVVGFAERQADLHNAAAILHDGAWAATYRKQRLPNYGVFDELRYFKPGRGEILFQVAGAWVGVSVCEDIWLPGGPVARLARAGADLIVNINASPFHRDKWRARHRMLATRASDHAVALAYVNQVGGQDELVFDGDSMVLGADGNVRAEAPLFEEHLLLADVELEEVFRARLHDPRGRHTGRRQPESVTRVALEPIEESRPERPPVAPRQPVRHDDLEETYRALVLGTHDYVRKNGFSGVVLGLSGGVDSSLVAAIAVDALGAEAVTGVSLPSRYSSEGSRTDAQALADNLGVRMLTLPIEASFEALLGTLAGTFRDLPVGVAEENIQARIRGVLLMALSNKFGWMLLTTGNKSEVAVGYSTLYGDMAGGFAVIKDVPKLLVYELCRWRNAQQDAELIPTSVLTKPPSAELRPDQTDQDSLPPYEVLDPILERYVEDDWSVRELVAAGHEESVVRRIVRLVDRSEYKRRQSAPGIKITPRAFGKDRRLPITSGYREP